jgi:hypothetical protein
MWAGVCIKNLIGILSGMLIQELMRQNTKFTWSDGQDRYNKLGKGREHDPKKKPHCHL